MRFTILAVAFALLCELAAAAPPAAEPGRLRDRVPADALAYVRVPSPWAFMLSQQGPGIAKAIGNEDNARALANIREGLVAAFGAVPDADRAPLLALLLGHLTSPVEAVALMVPVEVQGQRRAQPAALITAAVDLADHAALGALLDELAASDPQVSVLSPVQPGGIGVISYGGMAVALHFVPETRTLSAVVGTGLSQQLVAALLALPENLDHPMREAEARVDDTGLGLFAWVNVPAVLPFAQLGMPPEQLLELERWGLTKATTVSLGVGTANGKGHVRLAMDVPRSRLLSLLPVADDRVELRSVGDASLVAVLNGLDADFFDRLDAMLEQTGGPEAAAELTTALNETARALGFSLQEVLGALGPTVVGFADQSGEFGAVKVRDGQRWQALLDKMGRRDNVTVRTRTLAGKTIFHMRIRPELSPEEAADAGPYLQMVSEGGTAHLYWVEDSGYLVFGQVPQALADRYRQRPKQPINSTLQLNEGGAVDSAALLLSGRLSDVPRISYYYYLQTLQSLSDFAGAEVDLFALPSALELRLPEEGAVGVSLELGASTIAAQMSYDSTPLDPLVVPDASMIAVVGILAAVAIPAYQDYSVRAVVHGAVTATMASAQAYYASTGQLPGPTSELTAGAMSDRLSGLNVDANGIIQIEFAGPAPIAGKTLGIRPELRGGRLSSYTCEGGDLPKKYRPRDC